jgi:hypothetical protein
VKWYKHFTDSLSDPFIEELMDNFSHAGYVAWFGLIEIICKENGNKLTGKLEISPTYLKRKLRISSAKLKQIFSFCSTNGKLLFDFSQEKWSFDFPKVAEIKDNYTKDLQVASKKPSKHKEEEVEVEVKAEEEKKKTKKPSVVPSISIQGLADGWNEIVATEDGFKKVTKLTDDRKKRIRARLRTHPEEEFWNKVLNKIPRVPFLSGKNDRKWRADFDFLIKNDENALKIYEGKYDADKK